VVEFSGKCSTWAWAVMKFKPFEFRHEKIDPARGCFYLERWVLTVFGFSIRLHHWLNDDDQRYFHDHSFHMLIFILKGGYTDVSPDKNDIVSTGSIRFRKATHKHSVKINPGGCWSLLFTSPVVRHWGFWIPGRDKIMRPLRYFERYGHHQCD